MKRKNLTLTYKVRDMGSCYEKATEISLCREAIVQAFRDLGYKSPRGHVSSDFDSETMEGAISFRMVYVCPADANQPGLARSTAMKVFRRWQKKMGVRLL